MIAKRLGPSIALGEYSLSEHPKKNNLEAKTNSVPLNDRTPVEDMPHAFGEVPHLSMLLTTSQALPAPCFQRDFVNALLIVPFPSENMLCRRSFMTSIWYLHVHYSGMHALQDFYFDVTEL